MYEWIESNQIGSGHMIVPLCAQHMYNVYVVSANFDSILRHKRFPQNLTINIKSNRIKLNGFNPLNG